MAKSSSSASRIRLRPRHDVVHISRGRTALGMDMDGMVARERPRQGLFVSQTRMLSQYRWTIDGKQPYLSAQSPVQQHSWLAYYFQAPENCAETPTGECNPLQETIELKISRVVGEGMHEDIEVTNHTQIKTSVTLTLEVNGDFVSRSEVKDGRKQIGNLQKCWKKSENGDWRWRFDYSCEHRYKHQGDSGVARLQRAITLLLHCGSEPVQVGNTISFHLELTPHQNWKACLIWQAEVEGDVLPVEPCCNALSDSNGEYTRKTEAFLGEATRIRCSRETDMTATVQRVLDRSRLDLIALRLFDLDEGEHNWKLAAGIPTYLALFGRDMLASGWQAALLSNDMIRGGLTLLTKMQATQFNYWRGAQPGRMLHESHTDPLSVLNFTPQSRYYGTVTVPFLFPICVSELWHWTGDKEAVRPLIRPALDAIAWADKYSQDKSGFYKYKTLSEQGIKNQGWKDSADAIVYADGSQVENPLGTCEMQAFAYAAKVHFAETLWWLDESELALRLYEEAETLKKRFNDHFWMEDEGYIAMAVDKNDNIVKSVASDPGHCLLSGILNEELVPRVVSRMLRPDMFSGWGIRTLSSGHPAYNPFSYHRGTVWPVENGSFTLGMARYGLHVEMWQLARAQFEVATLFDYDRLPEVFGGHARDEAHPFPCLYESADSPQAWSASVPFMLIQALLGIYPYAPLNVLFLDPWLPDWLPEVKLEDLHVGNSRVSLHFKRNDSGNTEYSILQLDGDLHVLRQSSPWSFTAGWGERVKDAVMSLLPGK
jgi:glycogen debranching enzyme